MAKLAWRHITVQELASLLKDASLLHSESLGSATLYHFHLQQQDYIAWSLEDGKAILVEAEILSPQRRRHTETP